MTLFSFQSTHPHGVRPIQYVESVWWREFQSTHPHGVRQSSESYRKSTQKFQSTHPHGVRRVAVSHCLRLGCVSIHAPARGATWHSRRECLFFYRFNPRTRTGCDLLSGLFSISIPRFQSTHPHGVRQTHLMHTMCTTKFQSTHPHGVRHSHGQYRERLSRFQSTHPHGVRLILHKDSCLFPYVSIHAPARGATHARMS